MTFASKILHLAELFSKRFRSIHTVIHTTPYLADSVYALRRWNFKRNARKFSSFKLPVNWQDSLKITVGRLFIATTNQCNAQCVFCAHNKVDAKRGYMDLAMTEKILKQWKADGGCAVNFTVSVGEPTMDSNLMKKIEMAHNLGLEVDLTTNGTLLHRNDLYRQLVDEGLEKISISLDIPEGYERSYGTKQGNLVAANVFNFLQYNHEHGETKIRLMFRSVFKPREIIRSPWFKKIKPFLGKNAKAYFTELYDDWAGVVKRSDLIGAMHPMPLMKKPRIPCMKLTEPVVNYKGDIELCACRSYPGATDLTVGNVATMNPKDALNSPKGREIVNGFLTGNLNPLCKSCSLYAPIGNKPPVS